jgi:hypothetical protein
MTQITYARASLCRTTASSERKKINLDFKLDGSTVLHKLVFLNTSRLSEYLHNLEGKTDEHWLQHKRIVSDAYTLRSEGIPVWIGKGHNKPRFLKGQTQKSIRVDHTGCLIYELNNQFTARFYIDSWAIEIKFEPVDYQYFSCIGEYRTEQEEDVIGKATWR